MNQIKIGITVGDINGIGLEVILKTLNDEYISQKCTPIIYGSSKVVSYHRNITELEDLEFHNIESAEAAAEGKINIVACWNDTVNIKLGQISEQGGFYAMKSLEKAVEDLKLGTIDALVTAPIHKKAMQLANFLHIGHTEYLTETFGVKESLMLLVNDSLRVGLVTNHLPIKEVANALQEELILEKIQIMHQTLKVDFGIDKPRIAILGLNPHAGDEGLLGKEEINVLQPAILEAKNRGIFVIGPYAADGFFGAGLYAKFDGVLAMYHDQGLVAFKALSFGNGVNYTAGLPIVRTSPDHGTAFDLAGKNEADPSSFRQALFLAIDVVRNRSEYKERYAHPLRKTDEAELARMLKEEEKRLRELGEELLEG